MIKTKFAKTAVYEFYFDSNSDSFLNSSTLFFLISRGHISPFLFINLHQLPSTLISYYSILSILPLNNIAYSFFIILSLFLNQPFFKHNIPHSQDLESLSQVRSCLRPRRARFDNFWGFGPKLVKTLTWFQFNSLIILYWFSLKFTNLCILLLERGTRLQSM